MRIERQPGNIPVYHSSIPISRNCTSSDSIRYGKEVSSFWRTISIVRRKVSNFFRWILSFFFPIKRRAPVDINEIECKKKSEKNGISENWVFLDGKPTKNEIKYKKVGDFLHIEEIAFPDEEMHEHIGTLLEAILKKEEATGFTTEYLETAKILWCSGFTTEDKIKFGIDDEDTNDCAINNIIHMAREERNGLNQHYIAVLSRIEASQLQTADAMYDSIMGKFTCVNPKTTIALSDLLTLMDAVDAGSRPGISFDTVTFKKADA